MATLTALAVAGATGWSRAAQAERPRIAVVGMTGDKAPPELRERMGRAVADGLAAAGADIVTSETAILYRVRGGLEVDGRTFIIKLEMVDARSGEVLESREDRCEICTESEALETAGVAASALKAQVFKRHPALAVADIGVGAPAPAGALVTQPQAAPPEGEASPHPHRALGWIGVAAGAVAAGVGVWMLTWPNTQQNCMGRAMTDMFCESHRTWKPPGIGLLSGGVLALAAGFLAVGGVF